MVAGRSDRDSLIGSWNDNVIQFRRILRERRQDRDAYPETAKGDWRCEASDRGGMPTAVHREQRRPAVERNDILSMDFFADELADGRRFRALTAVNGPQGYPDCALELPPPYVAHFKPGLFHRGPRYR